MLRYFQRSLSTFSSKSLTIQKTKSPKQKPNLSQPLAFGKATSDHILTVDWDSKHGWSSPIINPYGPLILDPSCSVFHYATQCFESLKVYRTKQNSIVLFRPLLYLQRLRRSSKAAALPDFEQEELLQLIKKLILLDQDWIPEKKGFSGYIRSTIIGTYAQLGVVKPENARLFTFLTTVGPYFPQDFQPVSLYCDPDLVRSWPGGNGDVKIGANYASGIAYLDRVQKMGCQEILWVSNRKVTQGGYMNIFIHWKNKLGEEELITCPAGELILNGITRQSILEMVRDWNEFKVTEEFLSIDDLVEAVEEGRVIEMFGTGTASLVSPVRRICYSQKEYEIPLELGNTGMIAKRIFNMLLKIQYGEIDSQWSERVNQKVN